MIIAGVVTLTLGCIALAISTCLEWKRKEPIYALFMKVATGILAIGAILFTVGLG